ncbi:hypothetical protein FXO37_02452 [Capsicum annuum]|nr:hypothetical protein FXO37_02452 [Capsicum annuum]
MLFNAASDKFLKTRDSHYKGAENSGASVVIASGKGKSIATCEIDPPSDASPSTGLRKRPISKRPNNKTLYLGSAYNTRTTILKLKFTRTGLEPTQAKGSNGRAKHGTCSLWSTCLDNHYAEDHPTKSSRRTNSLNDLSRDETHYPIPLIFPPKELRDAGAGPSFCEKLWKGLEPS